MVRIDMIRVPLSVRFESIHDPPEGHTPGVGIEKDMENRLSKGGNLYETKINAGAVMLHFAAVISQTLFELNWIMGCPDKDYGLPEDFAAIAYCNV